MRANPNLAWYSFQKSTTNFLTLAWKVVLKADGDRTLVFRSLPGNGLLPPLVSRLWRHCLHEHLHQLLTDVGAQFIMEHEDWSQDVNPSLTIALYTLCSTCLHYPHVNHWIGITSPTHPSLNSCHHIYPYTCHANSAVVAFCSWDFINFSLHSVCTELGKRIFTLLLQPGIHYSRIWSRPAWSHSEILNLFQAD